MYINQALVLASFVHWALTLLLLFFMLSIARKLRYLSRGSFSPRLYDGMETPLKSGERAPDFKAETPQGRQVELSDYSGRRSLFVFASLDCPPCLEVIDRFSEIFPGVIKTGIEIALVLSDPSARVKSFVEERGINVPVLIAPREENKFFETYKAEAVPFYCFVNEGGLIEETGILSYLGNDWKSRFRQWKQVGETLSA
jgi:peroxiredoxin